MTVLDAFALVALLRGEPAASEVAALLTEPAACSAVNVGEVVDVMHRVYDAPVDDVLADLGALQLAGLVVVPLTTARGTRSGELRARHYHRARCAVSLADCAAAELAVERQELLATSDGALAAAIRAEGGEVLALPDSRGVRP